jgi:hypothetical protein
VADGMPRYGFENSVRHRRRTGYGEKLTRLKTTH